jgi:hypothetical protein
MSAPRNRTTSDDHAHEFARLMTITHAPVHDDDPIGHTSFVVLACACGIATVFPAVNYILTTRLYRDVLADELARDGLTLVPALDEPALATLRAEVRRGVGHDCDEWIGPDRLCALCGARL